MSWCLWIVYSFFSHEKMFISLLHFFFTCADAFYTCASDMSPNENEKRMYNTFFYLSYSVSNCKIKLHWFATCTFQSRELTSSTILNWLNFLLNVKNENNSKKYIFIAQLVGTCLNFTSKWRSSLDF